MQMKPFGQFIKFPWKLVLIWKVCFLLSYNVDLNFIKIYKLVWINLDQIWKRYERIRNQKNRKIEKKGKKWKGLGETIYPSSGSGPWPRNQSRTGTLSFSLSHTDSGPYLSSPSSSRISRLGARPSRDFLPPLILLISCLISSHPCA
jgi:hypothetical protein